MYQRLHCIALRTVRHSDRSAILTAWSRELGRVALSMPEGAGREARRRRALTMPLALFEGEADVRQGRDIMTMRDVRASMVGVATAAHPARVMVAMFVADVLTAVLRDSQRDDLLTDFLVGAVERLERADGRALANFPLVFLYRLSCFLGIEPDVATWRPGALFDMREARFVLSPPLHRCFIEAPRAAGVRLLSRLTMANMGRVAIPRDVRAALLDGILEYYSLHHVSLAGLTSLGVLRQLC